MKRLVKISVIALFALALSPLVAIVALVALIASFAAPDALQKIAPFPLYRIRGFAAAAFILFGLVSLGMLYSATGGDTPEPEVAAASTVQPTAAATAIPATPAATTTGDVAATLDAVDGQVRQLTASIDRLNTHLAAPRPDASGWRTMTGSELDTLQFLIKQTHGNEPAVCLQDGYNTFLATMDGIAGKAQALQGNLNNSDAIATAAADFAGANDTIGTAAENLRTAADICQ